MLVKQMNKEEKDKALIYSEHHEILIFIDQ